MNTAAHVLINTALIGKQTNWKHSWAAFWGAVVPDASMFVFYILQKLLRTPETTIWNEKYFEPGWQNFFDVFNSIPIFAVLLIWSIQRKWVAMQWVCISVFLHVALDLPLHHDDGHAHFWPLTNWKFSSPVSYWDPNHYGNIVGMAEVIIVLITGYICLRYVKSSALRITLGVLVGLQIVAVAMFLLYFG